MSGGFLARWSRRKLAAGLAAASAPTPAAAGPEPTAAADSAGTLPAGEVGAHPASPAAKAAAEAALPPVETLSLASDFSAFLKEEVSEALRRRALQKLFADPHFNRMDGLDVYIDDYNLADPIPPALMEKLKHAREWLDDAGAHTDQDRHTDQDSITEQDAPELREAAAPVPAREAGEPAAATPLAGGKSADTPPARSPADRAGEPDSGTKRDGLDNLSRCAR
ncbi:DUF3306 domain-containing protein [Thauera sp.]|uniref:DUF3306 domain-containing protein n=1 Tax=Thauera sp. TaxID=1905334 RepID=UPI002B67F250|nr:DUF3306 domain-containing protein [Thauera sp.]HRP23773.1 DUF3306 domain-containing protein [Thauera sp.]